ncbi:hypothetical protein MSTO_34770 [Mycobacterium stomatepiae]|uniref:Uncharacterized protein n=1 Tax=Mycobacterium stomatepiae TaxID=470076 RepID=A0A7I7QAZ0_9MYCO|nr:hypothetical protein MSTO_34770 [Mycobacterium stomatepiae]
MEPQRQVVVGVKPGCDNDIQLGSRRDSGDAGDVAAEPDHGEVDDGIHAPGLELVEALDGVSDPFLLVAPGFRIVLRDLRGHDEHVLVHQRHAEIGGIDGSARGI